MEQKRKVKSLISKNDTGELGYLSRMLIFLSCLFCFGALFLSIFSISFVDASYDTTEDKIDYNGLNEKKEVLYKLDFVRSGSLTDIKSTMRVDDAGGIDRLYITPIPIVVKKGIQGSYYIGLYRFDKYVNLLGGDNLSISGDNITIIGGSNLVVNDGNDNVTIFGGDGNKILSTATVASIPNVIAGGKNNTVKGHNAVILGGSGNIIVGENSFILGGRSNTVSGGVNNSIVAGRNVVADKDNIFVFSNDNNKFRPLSEKTFYINVSKGMGINMNPNKNKVVSVSGAVSFGNLGNGCSMSNSGLIGFRDGSLQGCSNSFNLSKIGLDDDGRVTSTDFEGYCTGADYLKVLEEDDRYKPCGNEANTYKNVVFETKLLTGSVNCEGVSLGNGKNPCVYTCAEHHSYDKIENKCMKDCVMPWNLSVFTGHGVIITGYSQSSYQCDNNASCDNVMAILRCDDGKWKKIGGDGSDDVKEDEDGNINYKYQSCNNLEKKSCNKDVYKFTKTISYWKQDGSSCKDYDASTCESHTYYKGECYPNYTFREGNCLVGNNSKINCKCVPQTRTGTCLDSSLPQNAVKLITGFKQIASGSESDNWYPKSKNYVYYDKNASTKGECTYKCDTGYLYSKGDSELNLLTGCWKGCVFWENNMTKVVYNQGTVMTGYRFPAHLCNDEKYVCIDGGRRNYDSYMKGENKLPFFELFDKCRAPSSF